MKLFYAVLSVLTIAVIIFSCKLRLAESDSKASINEAVQANAGDYICAGPTDAKDKVPAYDLSISKEGNMKVTERARKGFFVQGDLNYKVVNNIDVFTITAESFLSTFSYFPSTKILRFSTLRYEENADANYDNFHGPAILYLNSYECVKQ